MSEAHIHNLTERVTKTESQLEALTTDVRSLASSVDRLTQTMSHNQRANWPLFLSGVTTILAIVVLYVTPFTSAQEEIKDDFRKLAQAFVEHISDASPHYIDRRAKAINERIDAGMAIENERHAVTQQRLERIENFVVGRSERAASHLDGAAWSAVTRSNRD